MSGDARETLRSMQEMLSRFSGDAQKTLERCLMTLSVDDLGTLGRCYGEAWNTTRKYSREARELLLGASKSLIVIGQCVKGPVTNYVMPSRLGCPRL